jgi:hypothetical protein
MATETTTANLRSPAGVAEQLAADIKTATAITQTWEPARIKALTQLFEEGLRSRGVKPADAREYASSFGSYLRHAVDRVTSASVQLGAASHVLDAGIHRAPQGRNVRGRFVL